MNNVVCSCGKSMLFNGKDRNEAENALRNSCPEKKCIVNSFYSAPLNQYHASCFSCKTNVYRDTKALAEQAVEQSCQHEKK